MASAGDRESVFGRRVVQLGGLLCAGFGALIAARYLWESDLPEKLFPGADAITRASALGFMQIGLSLLLLERAWRLSRARKVALLFAIALPGVGLLALNEGQWSIAGAVMVVTAAAWLQTGVLNRRDRARRRSEELASLRRRGEEAQYHLAAFVDSSDEAIMGMSLEGAIFSWNRGALQLFGYSLGDVLGRSVSMLVPPDRAEETHEILKRIARNERVDQFQTVRLHKNGAQVYVSLTVSPIKDSAGTIIGAATVSRDLRERGQMEESRARLETILAVSDDAILSETLDGTIASWNPGAQRLYGYSAEETIGRSVGILIPQERLAEIPEILKHVKKGHRVDHYETVRIRKDGAAVHVSLTVSPIRDAAAEVVGAASIARDMTERLEMSKALEGRRSQLEAVDKELEAFTYAVSNDLSTPLRSIDGFTQIFLEDYGSALDPRGLDYLKRVRASCARMAHLVDNMFSLVRVSRREIRREPVNLSALAHRIAEDLRRAQPGRELEFVIKEGAVAEGDGGLLRIALENLMINACKFTVSQPRARIEFGVSRDEGTPIYYVRDDGAGVSIDSPEKAFDPLQPDGEMEGEGIGLATVRRIIHRHGGRVWAEGAAERGATFYFTL